MRNSKKIKLKDKIDTINVPKILELQNGKATSIEEFWRKCIEPMLPEKDVVVSWYKLLKKYVKDKDVVFAIRTYGSWTNKKHNNKELRRGFYTITNKRYSFFYTDNFFAAYFAKMVIDNYVPDYKEFKTSMINRTFPARFGRSTKEERKRAAYSIDGKIGKDPGFGKAGYKIAHIINSGTGFIWGNDILSIKEVCDRYYPRGKYNDWSLAGKDNHYERKINVDKKSKKLLVAHFMRFVCPLNYIFTPKKSKQIIKGKVYNNDIAESPLLQTFCYKNDDKKIWENI